MQTIFERQWCNRLLFATFVYYYERCCENTIIVTSGLKIEEFPVIYLQFVILVLVGQ